MHPTIDINDAQVLGSLARLRVAGGDIGLMRRIAQVMKTATQFRFRSQSGPDGQRWWPSNRARREGGQTLSLTGRLRRSIVMRATRDSAEVGTNVAYAAAHQHGVRKIVTVRAHRRSRKVVDGDRQRVAVRSSPVRSFSRMMFLPKRPFLGFGQAELGVIRNLLVRHLQQAVG